jgi:TolB-like protein/DNA-binding winged helix-turn-helix (wHTH) protein/Tfp pilus assembly protein PilF
MVHAERAGAMQASTYEEYLIRFGEFELAPKIGELRRGGQAVRLQPQPFKVLALLVERAGQLVTREEIQQQVWEGETYVDFEHGLNFCIRQIRSALGDNAQSPIYVETLPRRGYRFIASVERIDCREQSEARPPGGAAPRPANSRTLVRAAALVAATALIAFAYLAWQRAAPKAVPDDQKVMLAVLPFENLSTDAEKDYFSDGLTEEMIAQLGRLHPQRLGVIARTSAMTYKGEKKDVQQIGRELGVNFVLEGSVRREDDRVRITAQLIQVSDQTHLWAETYERSRTDALTVQSEVARRIARALEFELLPERRAEMQPGSTRDPEAFDLYLKGRYLLNKARRESLAKSVEYFEQAALKDPRYALAEAGLSDAYRLLAMYYVLPPREASEKAKKAAARALEIDERVAEAHVSMGSLLFRFDMDFAGAEKEFLRAIELNPSYGLAHHDYGWYLVAMGRMDEGLAEMKLARELDPLSPLANSDVGWVYLHARRYDEAIEQIRRTLELEPDFGSALGCLERAYLYKGMHREALDTARKEMAHAGASREELAALDRLDPVEAIKRVQRRRLDRRLETAKTRRVSPYSLAMLHASLGEPGPAFDYLERAFEERDPMLVSIRVDPAFDPLRAGPRFNELLRRIGLN